MRSRFSVSRGDRASRAARSAAGRSQILKPSQSAEAAPDSAWLDLRQNNPAHSKVQAAPAWVESVTFAPGKATTDGPAKSVFRIRLTRPNEDCQILLFRLYFDDKPDAAARAHRLGRIGHTASALRSVRPKNRPGDFLHHHRPDDRSDRDRRRSAGRRPLGPRRVSRLDEIEPGDAPDARRTADFDPGTLRGRAAAQGGRGRCGGFRNRDRAAHGRDDSRSDRACKMAAPFSSGSKRNRSSRSSLSKSRARRSMCRRKFT